MSDLEFEERKLIFQSPTSICLLFGAFICKFSVTLFIIYNLVILYCYSISILPTTVALKLAFVLSRLQ